MSEGGFSFACRPPGRNSIPMASDPHYRWLRTAGFMTLALAALLALYAWHQAREERRRHDDIGRRVSETMNLLEAEAQRISNEAAAP